MGRARTVWLRSMLVTAMVVQAFGFVGSAAANRSTNQGAIKSEFVQVGEKLVIYDVPIGKNNTITKVLGGFMIGITEVTYGEWYEVRMWAEKKGYTFTNKGREGTYGVDGAKPTSARNEPVTNISWYDVILWSNAKSVKEGLTPVYISRVDKKPISKYLSFKDTTVDLSASGYRLPTINEWEMAARWLGTTAPKKGSLVRQKITTKVNGVNHYWTPGNYASGAVENYLNKRENARVAWYNLGFKGSANAVGRKEPNTLGMYDVSGNVSEITLKSNKAIEVLGGGWNSGSTGLSVSNPYAPTSTSNYVGFRLSVSNPTSPRL